MSELLQLLANTEDAVCMVDQRQAVVQWNDSAERLFGRPATEVLGRPCFDVVQATDGRGCQVCRRGCLAVRLALAGRTVPTRDLRVAVSSGAMAGVSATTIVLPSGYRSVASLAHLFREIAHDKVTEPRHEIADGADVEGHRLTRREREILALVAGGAGTRQIAEALAISRVTVKNHVHHVIEKLAVHSRLEAVVRLRESGCGTQRLESTHRSPDDPIGSAKTDREVH